MMSPRFIEHRTLQRPRSNAWPRARRWRRVAQPAWRCADERPGSVRPERPGEARANRVHVCAPAWPSSAALHLPSPVAPSVTRYIVTRYTVVGKHDDSPAPGARSRYRDPLVAHVGALPVHAVDGGRRLEAGFQLGGLAPNLRLPSRCELANVFRIDTEPGTVPALHLGDDFLGVCVLDNDLIRRRDHPGAIDSGAAVNVDGLGRLLHDRQKEGDVIIEMRAAEHLDGTESRDLEVGQRLREVRAGGRVLECTLIIQLQADDRADTVLQEPLRVGRLWVRSAPQRARPHDAEVSDRGI